jgi:hypothetical protein
MTLACSGISSPKPTQTPPRTDLFSNIGFNNRHDEAFVYAGHHSCVGLCDAAGYILLSKTNGKWLILRDEVV